MRRFSVECLFFLYISDTLQEDTDWLTRQCCGPMRPFDMNITDMQGQEVIHLNRPLRCQGCCCPCCLQELEVSSPPGTTIGKIEQQWSIIYPKFLVKDQMGEPVLKIEGPFCTCSCFCNDVEFKITSVQTGEQVGRARDWTGFKSMIFGQVGLITKQWTGFGKEAFTDADNFGISFPLDLDVKVRRD